MMSLHKDQIEKLERAEYLLIEREHKQLVKYLTQLRDVCDFSKDEQLPPCTQCDSGKQSSCRGLLPSYLYDLIEVASKHFIHEEKVMLSGSHVTEDYKQFQMHRQAHSKIMQKLNGMVDTYFSQSNGANVSQIYRAFYSDISRLFAAHDKAFVDPFLKS